MTSYKGGSGQSAGGAPRWCGACNAAPYSLKIVNRSELGWKVVEEYEADELALGSRDEK